MKNPFERKQKGAIVILCIAWMFLFWSCRNKNEADDQLPEPLSDELISLNLSENGVNATDLLIGEWEINSFAYTADGRKISKVTSISNVAVGMTLNHIYMSVPIEEFLISNHASEPWLCMYDLSSILIFDFAYSSLLYSLSENLMNYITRYSPWTISVSFTEDGKDVINALMHAYSFVVKGDQLMIQFTGVEKRNLLILTKCKS